MRSWYRNLDLPVVIAWLILVGFGLVAIYSTTHGPASEFLLESVQKNFQRQFTWATICLIGLTIALFLPSRFYPKSAYAVYLATLGLSCAALVFGREINGAKAWIVIGPVSLQCAELAKVGTVMAAARFLSNRRMSNKTVRNAALAILLVLIPAGITLLQNDTGTALVFISLIPILLFWSGLPSSTVMLMVSPAVAGYLAIVYFPAAVVFAVLFTLFLWVYTKEHYMGLLGGLFTGGTAAVVSVALTQVLQPHQVARIASFTNPEAYRLTSGYHIIQAKAAIGSGGVFGKGFMEGTQTQLAFIPEQSTDFVFSVIGEEFGLVGSLLLLGTMCFLLIRLVILASRVRTPFATLFIAGSVGVYLIHVLINIGMATGLMPVIGIPLPFVSYGGSALLANTALLAIGLNLHARRDDFSIYAY